MYTSKEKRARYEVREVCLLIKQIEVASRRTTSTATTVGAYACLHEILFRHHENFIFGLRYWKLMTECGIRASIGRKLPQLRLFGSSSFSTVVAVVLLVVVIVVVVVVVVAAGVEYGYGVDRGLHVIWMSSEFRLFSHLVTTFLSTRLFLFCFFSAATLMYRTTPFLSVAPLPSPPTLISYLRDGLLRDVLRYTLDRGIFIVSCGSDAERTVTSAPIRLFGVVLEMSQPWRADDCGRVGCFLSSLVGIVIASS